MAICGVYEIWMPSKNKSYIGSSLDCGKRIVEHFRQLRKGTHHSNHLQNAYNKYGKSVFVCTILFQCKPEGRLRVEQACLDGLTPEYNCSKSAHCPMDGRKHSKESREKMKGRPGVKGSNHYLFGKTPSPETKEKQRLRRLGTTRSTETKTKMADTAKRLNSISRIDREKQKKSVIDSLGITHSSMASAALYHGVSVQTVCDILKGRHFQTRKKVTFKYV
jgi:group I intron endonuclease